MRFKYCPHCGQKLMEKEIGDEGLVSFCEPCNSYGSSGGKCFACID